MTRKDRLAWMLHVITRPHKEPGVRWDLYRNEDPRKWTLRRRGPDGDRLTLIPDSEMQNRRTATAALERAVGQISGKPITVSLV